ncbi:DUF1549 and DUF1553 domain-containing protein [Allorhodopirellula solitaria]|uniref:Bacterial Ig-like domain (Group 2) n=1 Tax=Allorhodopirellula solitaria TaxID=2527987 RepID=A0A5C5YIR1_9BACT|nr:DUF1549 and DUF1553 domain-containing protein [Allorhodopirellula solitaria]TWT74750.1 Bacterial Ig-like domain (group 2) [Allorhodopirellula solitaria]
MIRIFTFLFLLSVGVAVSPAEEVRLLPEAFLLSGSESQQQLSTVTVRENQISAIVPSDQVQLESDAPEIVEIRGGVAHAVSSGNATITARLSAGRTATAEVEVTGVNSEHNWSFRNDVQSILTKAGCNAGACHGALAGKGGFRLSLKGYDSDADYLAITREAHGRRIEIGDPGQSLVLAKPSAALPHKGGLKLDTASRDYQVIADWIAAGAAAPEADDPQLVRISVSPESALLSPGDQSRILVHAHYDDETIVDVTHWSQFTATDESIASVDEHGKVLVRGSGEAAILVWFGSRVALARMTVPYPNEIPADVYAVAERRNFIDELNLTQLQTLRLRPSPACDDETFLRRATVDTIGRLPTHRERERYFAADSETRRDELIDRLLASDDFVDYWTYRWSDVLLINGNRLRPDAVKAYYQWLHAAVERNQPWDELVNDVLTATGSSIENGATNFYALHQTPEEMTENACQAFLGLSIGCAKCHNHPLEKWTNDQYYSMANLFARVRAKGWGGDSRNGNGHRTLYVSDTGDLIQPQSGKPQPPAALDAEPLPIDDPADRRIALAEWMTDSSNPYFARAITNRVWANFFGRGLVEQVDDLRHSNPASNEPLMTAAAQHLIDADFNLKSLMRAILRSATYGRSSLPLDENRDEQKYLSRYYPRRMMAEVLLDSIDQTLETQTSFTAVSFSGADRQKTDFYEPGTRAIELYDSAVDSYFLQTFGRNPREIVCECERSSEPSMVQVLHLSNGDTLNTKLADSEGVIARMVDADASDAAIIDHLFLSGLSRHPTDEERDRLQSVIEEYGEDRLTALQDVAWSVVTSTEFVFNH